MKKLFKVFVMVVAPVLVFGALSGCASTPNNREISSVGAAADQDEDTGGSVREYHYNRDGFNRE